MLNTDEGLSKIQIHPLIDCPEYRNYNIKVLKGINLQVNTGEMVAIMGASGSGKSTLLNILGLLDTPTSGNYFLEGREVSRLTSKELALEIKNLSVRNDRGLADLDNFTMKIHRGQILGIAGVAGNGQKALAEVLTGLKVPTGGRILAGDRDITNSSARGSYIAGIAHIPEDRKTIGIAPDMTVDDNLIMKNFNSRAFRRWIFQDRSAIRRNAAEKIDLFSIKAGPAGNPVRYLSGGNIQKVIIARELSENPAVLVALYPTRGLDIGSAEYVHKVIADGASNGMSTILISEDLDELLKLSDEIVVMFRGRLAGSVDPETTTREEIGLLMSGEVQT